jgi:hypothetical protein
MKLSFLVGRTKKYCIVVWLKIMVESNLDVAGGDFVARVISTAATF